MIARTSPLLFLRHPGLSGRLPWAGLSEGAPTPIERLSRLGARLGLFSLFVKRDDKTSALYGGNKVRKLEWILGLARARRARRLVTLGAWGSHHALATAIFARQLGLEATLVLSPQPATPHVREQILADLGAGARVLACRKAIGAPFALLRAMLSRPRPFFVAPGGSDARGTLGYVECALEIAEDVRAGRAPAPDFVYAAAGTGGTAAGLALGLALAAREVPALEKARVVAVRVVPKPIVTRSRIVRLARAAARLLARSGAEIDAFAPVAKIALLEGHLGKGYGFPTDEAREMADAAREEEGLFLETTYTAKAMAGLRAFASAGERRRAVHLYVHTLNGADLGAIAAKGDLAALPSGVRRRIEERRSWA